MRQQKPYTLISALLYDNAICARGIFLFREICAGEAGALQLELALALKMNFHAFYYITTRNRHGRRP